MKLNKILLKGLVAILPIAATLYLLVWLMTTAEHVLGGLLQIALPDGWYRPGMGLVAGIGVVLAVGFMMENFFARKVVAWVEEFNIPGPVYKEHLRRGA